jgi:hypothetical protein
LTLLLSSSDILQFLLQEEQRGLHRRECFLVRSWVPSLRWHLQCLSLLPSFSPLFVWSQVISTRPSSTRKGGREEGREGGREGGRGREGLVV